MIEHISIRDFAIIENAEVDFRGGLSVITGETGSGKSIVITAISLALGSRADSSYVRNGREKAVIQLSGTLDGEETVLTREISSQGRNLCRVDGNLVTLSELAARASLMADIHGQYDNQSLLDPANHLAILDGFGRDRIRPAMAEYSKLYDVHREKRSALDRLLAMEAESARRADFYRYEIKEIDSVRPVPGEDEELASRVSLLKNSGRIFESISSAYERTEGDRGALTALGIAMEDLESVSSYTPELGRLSGEMNDLYYRLEDLTGSLRQVMDSLTFSPDELDRSIERLSKLEDLKKKYAPAGDLADVISYRDRIASELDTIENLDSEKERLRRDEAEALTALRESGKRLSSIRKDEAERLSSLIERELLDLNFSEADFSASLIPSEAPLPTGLETCEFLISANRGEPLRPLAKTASGGELSRIMLAIKAVTSSFDGIPTLIFDEIDQGISGKTAYVVGHKLREIAKTHQVICITHLPQIAAQADESYRIYKDSDLCSTYTHVDHLDAEGQVREIARLLGGETVTETTLENARELIRTSRA